jgi:predicted nucleic acid-binding protein
LNIVHLVDNSALQRARINRPVAYALAALLKHGPFASCLPQLLEQGYSARTAAEHELVVSDNLRRKLFLPPNPQVAEAAMDLQTKLFAEGQGRAVGVSDLHIAATALAHTGPRQQVVVIHYDADFDALARVEPMLVTRWVVPRGSVP